jgi:putative phosphoesterase
MHFPRAGFAVIASWGCALRRKAGPMLVGVISDTHGLLRAEAIDVLRGSDLIIHAGDVGKLEVLDELRQLAPVYAVRGNVDTQRWAADLPIRKTVPVGLLRFHVLHDIAEFAPGTSSFAAILFGHSHRPAMETRNGVLYLNPGSAGPRRFKLPVSVARVHVSGLHLRPEIVELAVE